MTDRVRPVTPAQALKRLQAACILVSRILDGGADPQWCDSQELEASALDYGRALRRSRRI